MLEVQKMSNSKYLVEVENLQKWFPARRTMGEVFKGEQRFVKAVDGVSFKIE